jgi:hypothetical protein
MSISDTTQMGTGAPPRNGKAGRRFAPALGSGELLYLLQAGDREVKVGVTKNVPARIAALQTGNPQPIKVVRVWHHPKARLIESAVLSACEINITSGEWLALDPDHAERIIEVIIGSFEVTHCREIVRDKPEKSYKGTSGTTASGVA